MLESISHALFLVLLLSGVPLLCSMVVGLVVSILQTVTQIQEQTLSFIPKIIMLALVLVFFGSGLVGLLIEFTSLTFVEIAKS